jgi:hypothetical protein
MTSNPSSPNFSEDDTSSIEDDENTMDEQKFLKQWEYSLRSDFTSESGTPATWAPGHPKHWGEEDAKINLDGEATTPTISHDNKFVAVGIRNEIHVFDLATHVRAEVLGGHPGEVGTVIFAPCFDHASDTDKARYLLASQREQEGGANGFIILWELDENGEQVLSVNMNPSTSLQFAGELGSFGSPVFSPDGKSMVYLVSNVSIHSSGLSHYVPSVKIWDIQSRSVRRQLDAAR